MSVWLMLREVESEVSKDVNIKCCMLVMIQGCLPKLETVYSLQELVEYFSESTFLDTCLFMVAYSSVSFSGSVLGD